MTLQILSKGASAMKSSGRKLKKGFVKLDQQVSLASAYRRVIKTTVAGRELGFGCNLQR